MAAVQQALADVGAAPLTAVQVSALKATLTYVQGNLAGITASSSLTYASCP
ncbi:MAG: hypothetical protein JOZ69_19450 [Myxococcales bacterium]|nr:hypothetical protein [Myxococcales bacterium]